MITKKIWEDWTTGKVKNYYTSSILNILINKKVSRPELYLNYKEYTILKALNNTNSKRTQTEIRHLTRLSYPYILKVISKFEGEGLVRTTKIIKKRKEKKTNKKYVEITSRGLELLKQWEEVYSLFL